MYRIIIARHGESIWNQDSKFTGWTNIPLTDKGRLEAKKMADILKPYKPSIIFTSVLQRSIETSTIIQKNLQDTNIQNKDIPIHTSWRLNEKHYGTLEGIPRKYIRDVYGDLFTQMMRSNFTMKPPILKTVNEMKYPIYKNCYLESIKYGESKENVLSRLLPYYENDILYTLSEGHTPVSYTHLTLPTIYSV